MSSNADSTRDVEEAEDQTGVTPEENANPNTEDDGTKMNRGDEPPYDFEVKEQDRWLPIANGESRYLASPVHKFTGSHHPPHPFPLVLPSARTFVSLSTKPFRHAKTCTSTDPAAVRPFASCPSTYNAALRALVCRTPGESESLLSACDLQPTIAQPTNHFLNLQPHNVVFLSAIVVAALALPSDAPSETKARENSRGEG
jgi:hypothetical protein